jgi:hypothetical protein
LIAIGFARPTMVATGPDDRIWLAGRDSGDREGLTSFVVDEPSSWPIVPVSALAQTRPAVKGSRAGGRDKRLYLAAAGALRRIIVSPDGAARSVKEIPLAGDMTVMAAATAQEGTGYAALSADEEGPSTIVRITPR